MLKHKKQHADKDYTTPMRTEEENTYAETRIPNIPETANSSTLLPNHEPAKILTEEMAPS